MWQIMLWDPTPTMSQKLRLRNTTNNVAKFKASTVDSSKSSSCIKSPRYFLRSLLKKRPMEFLYVIPDLDKLWMNKLQLFCRRKFQHYYYPIKFDIFLQKLGLQQFQRESWLSDNDESVQNQSNPMKCKFTDNQF